jgi:radical SAM protein with 4Fe4S-binding SPASM domain
MIARNKEFLRQRFEVGDVEALFEFPRFFEVETTHACNARCIMCPIETWPKRISIMPDEIFTKLADEMAQNIALVQRVTLARDGEPLTDKKLEARIRQLKDVGIREVVFSTNASLLTESRAHSLLESGLDAIFFSVDGHTKKTFETIRLGLDYADVVANIHGFLRVRQELKGTTRVRLRMVVQDANKHEYEAWRDYWIKQLRDGDQVYGKLVHNWGNQVDTGQFLQEKVDVKAPVCGSLWSTMVVHSDGTVPGCVVDSHRQYAGGNVAESTIKDLWRNQMIERLREMHIRGQQDALQMCRGCYLWDPTSVVG